jgi:energy-coupling factor transport system substrate-specific component
MKLTVRELVALALMTALLFVAQAALSFLPNIELVSLLIIVYTLCFRQKVLYVIYAFAVLEGLLYGFSMWWVTYLYVWTVLAALAWAFRRMQSPLGWAILSGAFGLGFGALCEIPFLMTIGWRAALAAWVSGIPFDLLHCGGNFLAALALFVPLRRLMDRLAASLHA